MIQIIRVPEKTVIRTFREEAMRSQGFPDAAQMTAAFKLLRSNDLIGSKMTPNAIMSRPAFDLQDPSSAPIPRAPK